MDTKHLLCREVGRILAVLTRVLPLMCLLLVGCGSSEATPPRRLPTVNTTRYERIQVVIDGKPIEPNSTITVDRDFVVTVSFRRLHIWPEINNPESHLLALVMQQIREHEVTRRNPSLQFESEKDGVLTFTGKIEGLKETGIFGFWIQEAVTTETLGLERYLLFATNVRNVKP